MSDTPDTPESPGRDPETGRLLPGHSVTSKFKPEYVEQARKLAQLGATDYEVADFFNISVRVLYRWKHSHPDFADELRVGKAVADDRVEMSLYKKATGYTFDSEKIFCQEGQVIRTTTVEHVAPDTSAATFWLTNRRKEHWRHKVEHEHEAGGTLADLIAASMKTKDG